MYRLTDHGVIRSTDGAFIPADASNRDWRLFQAWLAEGNTAEPGESLAEVRRRMWQRVRERRDAIKAGGVRVGAAWFHTDADSRIQYLGMKDAARDLLAAGKPETTRLQKLGQDVRWKTMDGSFIYFTIRHSIDIVEAVGNLDARAFAAAEAHRAALDASPNPAVYDFSAGWPETFEG
ncbi:DUF4376 domain-containing protein [Metapseudomonas otitidis]|uniref:DUF4376 domain-containing protein n=1 Tax=Metapseudomonas otitidis TaxID=319939 RepID=UPI0013F5A1F1|nr:DUF4376 domain-containing protein [Pseudomonas otitidis]